MGDTPQELGLQALAELHRRDEANGRDPFGRERVTELLQPQPPGARAFRIEEPDWDRERRERQEAERAARAHLAAALLEEATPPPRPDPPAPKRKWLP